MKKAVALCILLACLSGCGGSRYGTYTYQQQSTNWLGQSITKKYAIELKSHEECVFASSEATMMPTIAGTYTVEGDKITFKCSILGSVVVGNAHFDGNVIVTDDTMPFAAQMHLTKQP